jgi:hypothetical protein
VIDWLAKEKGISGADALRELGGGRNGSKIVKAYDYTDERGQLLYQVWRFEHMSVILSEAKYLWSSLELISSRQLEMSRFAQHDSAISNHRTFISSPDCFSAALLLLSDCFAHRCCSG